LVLGRCNSIRREVINILVSFVYEGSFVSYRYVDEANVVMNQRSPENLNSSSNKNVSNLCA